MYAVQNGYILQTFHAYWKLDLSDMSQIILRARQMRTYNRCAINQK